MSAIRKYNAYCTILERLYNPACKVPLPQPLPTKLAELRDNSTLMEDVWMSSCGKAPLWFEDVDVRSGIQAVLRRDRCQEEQQRLVSEAGNMCRWFHREFLAVELALRQPSSEPNFAALLTQSDFWPDASIHVHLTRHRDRLLQLTSHWDNPLIPSGVLDTLLNDARRFAFGLTGGSLSYEARRQCADGTEFNQELSPESEELSIIASSTV